MRQLLSSDFVSDGLPYEHLRNERVAHEAFRLLPPIDERIQLAARRAIILPRRCLMLASTTRSSFHGLAFGLGISFLAVGCDSGSHSPGLDASRDLSVSGSGGANGTNTGSGGAVMPGTGGLGVGGATAAGTGGTADAGRDRIGSDSRDAPVDAAVETASDRIADTPEADAVAARDSGADSPGMPEAGVTLDGAGLRTVSYANDPNTIFANPERGFYQVNEVYASSYQALSRTWLEDMRGQSGVSLHFQMVYLDSFVNADLSQTFLDALAADFTTIRKAGVKAVVRFAYTPNSTKPYGDASKTRVLGHIAQLKPVLFGNSDVIAVVHAGFIGAWGEWYYTDYFGDDGNISASQWTDRQDVVNALLDALDLGRPIQLRTPAFKQHFYGKAALTSAEAFSGASKARVGHHNDCFLASADDMGTYTDVAADKAYLGQENLYVPQGGETCATSSYSGWSNAQTEMSNQHWSFLNSDYHPDVLASWGSNIDIAKRKLGYRLSLVSGAYAAQASAGSEVDVALTIRNDGFAPPFSPRELNLILRGRGASYIAKLPDDPRRFVPGAATTVARKICLPASMAPGSYALLLALADPVPALNPRPEYSIRLANQGTWESATGYNNLGFEVIVATAGAGSPCSANAVDAVALP
jgi:hypothetical protein